MKQQTIDQHEIDQFNQHADQWWKPDGIFKPLHHMNPCRLTFIKETLCKNFNKDPRNNLPLKGLSILDAGCGGGLLTEPLTRLGASVTGIDAGDKNIEIAKEHAKSNYLDIDYQVATPADLNTKKKFDVVISLEVIEHVADIQAYVQSCTKLVKKEGILILSTLNRTPLSYLGAIVMGEYLLRWIPQGTHNWHKFVKPAELEKFLEKSKFTINDMQGMVYKPLSKEWTLSKRVDVNYIVSALPK
jgi:2-polyprenyl-6-hydroxyphenyl methylase/3-demethylubiquinone-9 3-methyltransferase